MTMSFGQLLQEFRLSGRQAAEILGIPRNRVALLAKGEVEPSKLEQFALNGLAVDLRSGAVKVGRVSASGGAVAEALPSCLTGTQWAAVTARLGLPWLAQNPVPVSYGDFHHAVVERGGKPFVGLLTKYAWPLGRIGGAMQEASTRLGKPVPPLEVLVYNAKTNVPSRGVNPFLREYFSATSRRHLAKQIPADEDTDYSIIELVQGEITNFPDWDEVVRALGLTGDPEEDA
ncbi:MAG: hypothetical protein Q8R97_10030 [Brevundimonas sp.]|nr:hypothetical protein [Brevundimonas sp.]